MRIHCKIFPPSGYASPVDVTEIFLNGAIKKIAEEIYTRIQTDGGPYHILAIGSFDDWPCPTFEQIDGKIYFDYEVEVEELTLTNYDNDKLNEFKGDIIRITNNYADLIEQHVNYSIDDLYKKLHHPEAVKDIYWHYVDSAISIYPTSNSISVAILFDQKKNFK